MKLVFICGSANPLSANRAALRHAVDHLEGESASINVTEVDLSDVPIFDPSLADSPPASVLAFSEQLSEADGLMIAAPEYAAGLSGGTKTALDWLVGLGSLYHRPVAVMSAGTTGGEFAVAQLVQTLSWQGALVVATLGISTPRTKMDEAGDVTDPALASAIEAWASQLVAAVSGDVDTLKRLLTNTITPFGIDAARFGDLA